ncbi:MAG: hypothetical protein HFI76_12515 [Lachnospiraceae bacterium]|jgi:hypothetical protein|nr:hypothetical protein [Lachnospiraceae bacterium]
MDYIDKRNQREKMAHSIIKRRNVIYAPPEVIGEKPQKAEAEEILDQLEKRKQEGEAQKLQKIQEMVQQQEQKQEADQAEINRILDERKRQLEKNIESGKES